MKISNRTFLYNHNLFSKIFSWFYWQVRFPNFFFTFFVLYLYNKREIIKTLLLVRVSLTRNHLPKRSEIFGLNLFKQIHKRKLLRWKRFRYNLNNKYSFQITINSDSSYLKTLTHSENYWVLSPELKTELFGVGNLCFNF